MRLINRLQKELQKELPGEAAHFDVIPINRPISSKAIKEAEYYRESGVALILVEKDNKIQCILMKRSVHPGSPHSGQIALPGGKKEDFDLDLEETARRETMEEIGVQLEQDSLLGTLTPIYIPVSKFKVQPYIYHYTGKLDLRLDPLEVDDVFMFDIAILRKEDIIQRKEILLSQGYRQKGVPYFDIENETVWGATAMILSEFRQLLLRI
ncbi:MAG: NUDIX hydrolase [Crocinitomicaceae bacterium]